MYFHRQAAKAPSFLEFAKFSHLHLQQAVSPSRSTFIARDERRRAPGPNGVQAWRHLTNLGVLRVLAVISAQFLHML
ncbi:MAG: hypothetical protein C0393_05835 [Anaerolinea sp.]|nr:hypothetical protein [Anaerolinea sp.]